MDTAKRAEGKVLAGPDKRTAAIVKLITEIGPDIAEISRQLGQYKESVRYRYKEKLVKRGFAIKAEVNYSALGLIRVVMKLRVSAPYSQNTRNIFKAMSELCYLVAYAGTMPDDAYIVDAGVPAELTQDFHELIEQVKEKGLFSKVEFFDCDWSRVVPMRAECFNFEEGVWDFDWNNPPPFDDNKAGRATISGKKRIDKVDLLLLKELWKDSDRPLKEIQSSIKEVDNISINYKTLIWHYRNHVLAERLIRDYSIAWHGMRHGSNIQKMERVGKYGYLGVSMIVRETTEQERMTLRSQLNRLPFVWSEAAGEAYYSQFFFPLGMVNEALEYLKTTVKPYGERTEILLLDRREMTSFTIGYNLWDEPKHRWTLDKAAVLHRLESSVLNAVKRH